VLSIKPDGVLGKQYTVGPLAEIAATKGGFTMVMGTTSTPEQEVTVRLAAVGVPCQRIVTVLVPCPVRILPRFAGETDHWNPPGGDGKGVEYVSMASTHTVPNLKLKVRIWINYQALG
jgi:hypothetical protein